MAQLHDRKRAWQNPLQLSLEPARLLLAFRAREGHRGIVQPEPGHVVHGTEPKALYKHKYLCDSTTYANSPGMTFATNRFVYPYRKRIIQRVFAYVCSSPWLDWHGTCYYSFPWKRGTERATRQPG